MKIFKFTSQPFLSDMRKVSTHFIAEEWAKAGHTVHVATVGLSYLTLLKNKALFQRLSVAQKNRFAETSPGLFASAYMPPLHPFSSGKPLLNMLNRPFFGLYGSMIPGYMKTPLAEADVVIFEPGTCLSFYEAVRRFNPKAACVYIQRDWLETIGAAAVLQEMEQRMYRTLDLVITPSSKIAAEVPAPCRVEIVPQAINKDLFDADTVSPYPENTRNAISVGNMLFDETSLRAMAEAAPDVTFHIFGAHFAGPRPANVIEHGEKPFAELIPYMKHADFGIAPYRISPNELYLAETSLKFLQYAYCRLPVLTPDLIEDGRGNLIGYSLEGETDWPGKIRAALTMEKSDRFQDGILTWEEVAEKILELAQASVPAEKAA
ncbi:polysaccharide biosynthesis protein GumK [Roseibium aggregatum]|uniref:Polysaccharide biosynthesis protein GumK n=1 Tax=Roseibium aggregatum TaxID=187304 RepID=A0A926P2U6_9HYPH|nr:polysaccharide biosynthesis protein GumK [Roseibium aggregatum]MBD1548955.1 polysaccharide biosynthesis protein GumK [Roseibium aggregatum]